MLFLVVIALVVIASFIVIFKYIVSSPDQELKERLKKLSTHKPRGDEAKKLGGGGGGSDSSKKVVHSSPPIVPSVPLPHKTTTTTTTTPSVKVAVASHSPRQQPSSTPGHSVASASHSVQTKTVNHLVGSEDKKVSSYKKPPKKTDDSANQPPVHKPVQSKKEQSPQQDQVETVQPAAAAASSSSSGEGKKKQKVEKKVPKVNKKKPVVHEAPRKEVDDDRELFRRLSEKYQGKLDVAPVVSEHEWQTVGESEALVKELKQKLTLAEEEHRREREESLKRLKEYKEELSKVVAYRAATEQKLSEKIKKLETEVSILQHGGTVASGGDPLSNRNYVVTMKEKVKEQATSKKDDEEKQPTAEPDKADKKPQREQQERKHRQKRSDKGKDVESEEQLPEQESAEDSKKGSTINGPDAAANTVTKELFDKKEAEFAEERKDLLEKLKNSEQAAQKSATEVDKATARSEAVERDLAALKSEKQKLTTSLEERLHQVESANAKADVTERELGAMKGEMQKLTTALEEKRLQVESVTPQVAKLTDQLTAARNESDQFSRELALEKKTVAELRVVQADGVAEAERKLVADLTAEFENQKKAAQELKSELNSQKQASDTLRSELDAQRQVVSKLHLQLETATRAVEAERKIVDELKAKATSDAVTSAKLADGLKLQLEEEKTKVRTLSHDANDAAARSENVAQLAAQLESKKREHQDAVSKLDARVVELEHSMQVAEEGAKKAVVDRARAEETAHRAQQQLEEERSALALNIKQKEDRALEVERELAEEKAARLEVYKRLEEVSVRVKELEGGAGLKVLLNSAMTPTRISYANNISQGDQSPMSIHNSESP